jgi:hypothetical protein
MALDPSGGGGVDEFAWAVVKAWAGNFYLVESGGKKNGVDQGLWDKLASIAKRHHVNEILVETNFGGLDVYSALLKPALIKAGAACRIEPIRSNQRKELRIIDTLAPVLQTHRMVIDRRVIEADYELIREAVDERSQSYSVFYQMTRLTQDRGCLLHDDRLDAWALAVAWFQEQAAQDQNVRRDARQVELLEAMVADWRGNALLTPDRLAMGMSLEQARMADAGSGSSWL